MSRQAVRNWLELLTMEKYTDNFLERGYDSLSHCKLIISSDLVMLGVDDASHRKLLLNGVQFLINSPESTCLESCELRGHSKRKEEDIHEGTAAAKYIELFKFLDTPRQVYGASTLELPKMPASGSPDQDELFVTPRKSKRLKCRKAIEFQEVDDTNCIVID